MIVWISLGAVIVIIIVIGVLFRLFLRAEDADPFDELPDEPVRPSRAHDDARLREPAPREAAVREPVAAAAARRQPPRQAPVDDLPRPGDRGPRGPEDRGQPGYRERGGQDRQAGPDRRNSGGQSRPVPAGARPARPRSAEAAAQTAKWDKMSDVDYWTELAADNAAEAAAAPAEPVSSPPARRRTREPVADIRAAARGDRSPDAGDRTVQLPVRQRPPRARTGGGGPADYGQPQPTGAQPTGPRPVHAPGRYAGGTPEPATQSIAALARLGSQPPVSQPPAAQPPVSQPRRKPRPVPPPVLDDDPLTSPSFPAINASDSRSYRTSRPDTQPGRVPAAPAYADPPAAAYGDPARQPRQPRTYPAATDRVVSQPGGYPVQPAAPAGNPYGSFVTQPTAGYQQQAPAASHQDTSYSSQDPGYGRQDPGYGQAAQAGGWYGADGQPAAPAAMPAFTATPPGTPGGYLNGGQIPNGHDAAGNQVSYQGSQPEAAQYPPPAYPAVQYDQRGYAGQEPGYGLDGYQGYPGYGTGGY
jgi:hypothetical protein